jgi:CopG family nickel-responsive transcriptional regulator
VLHIHIDEKNCLEIIAVRGGVDKLKTLIGSLTACRGVKALKHTIIGI